MLNLGIDPEILEAAESLENCTEYKRSKYVLEMSAWYNGREKGVSIAVKREYNNSTFHIFVIAECRNSDKTVVYSWLALNPYPVNPPTPMDMQDDTYQNRKEFSTVEEAKMHVMGELFN